MKKIILALCAPLIVMPTHSRGMLARALAANLTPPKVSFFSRDISNQEDVGVLLRALKEFLYEQGLYDAAEIVIALERGMEEPHIHTAP